MYVCMCLGCAGEKNASFVGQFWSSTCVCVCVRVWVGECVRLCMRECVYVFVLLSGEER